MTNLVPRQYREVSVTTVDFPLTDDGIRRYLLGREVYQRTRYLVLRRGEDTALVEVEKVPDGHVMAVVRAVSILAGPDECTFVTAPDVDTGVPSSLAGAARKYAPFARGVAVEGRYHHINFILDPSPLVVRVVDVVPPGPPKLFDQAERVLALAEDLRPLELVADVRDLAELAASLPAATYLLPCRGSGFTTGGDSDDQVAFLDERPPRQEWTLIGCSRSRQLHRWFYGDVPDTIEMCPRVLAAGEHDKDEAAVTLTKCCLLEDRIDCEGTTVVVPWGASLAQVRQGLELAADLAEATEAEPERADAAEDTGHPEATWSRA